MIPLRLLDCLEKRLTKVFSEKIYKRPPNNVEDIEQILEVPMQFFKHNLPNKEEENQIFAPFTLLKLNTGGQKNYNSSHITNVSILVGMYDETLTTGYQDVALALNDIMQNIKDYPIIEGMFELDYESPIDWEIADEETYPHFFGGINLNFKTVFLDFERRKDVEGLI